MEGGAESWCSRTLVAACGAAALLVGCIQDPPDLSASSSVGRHVSKEAPSPTHKIGAKLGGGIELLGYDIDPENPSAGDSVRLTWYWHCLEELDEGYQLFTQ